MSCVSLIYTIGDLPCRRATVAARLLQKNKQTQRATLCNTLHDVTMEDKALTEEKERKRIRELLPDLQDLVTSYLYPKEIHGPRREKRSIEVLKTLWNNVGNYVYFRQREAPLGLCTCECRREYNPGKMECLMAPKWVREVVKTKMYKDYLNYLTFREMPPNWTEMPEFKIKYCRT